MTKPITKRPAEAGAVGIAVLVGAAITLSGIDLTSQQATALIVLIGAVPGVITSTVEFFRAITARSA